MMNISAPWYIAGRILRRLLPAIALAGLCTLCILAAGCESQYKYDIPFIQEDHAFFKADDDTPIVETNYEAAEELGDRLKDLLPSGSPIYVMPFTNMNNPSDTAPFGRVVAEEVASGLTQEGHKIVFGDPNDKETAMKFLNEYAESERPLDQRPIEAVLSGNYVIGNDRIYISATIKRLNDNMFVGRYDWNLPLNKNTRELLPALRRSGRVPSVRTTPPAAQQPVQVRRPASDGGQFME